MAVAAYAAVVSLMHVLDQILEMHMLHLDGNQIETLHKKVSFLQDFLEVHSQIFYEDLEDLARQIAAVADEAEDIIHTHVVDQLRKGSGHQIAMDLSISDEGLENVIEKIDVIKKELTMNKKGMTIQEQQPRVSDPTHSLAPPSSGNDNMVGFNEQFDRIVLELTGEKDDLQVLPIVGMGGIGKTTLSRTIFENKYIGQHFDIRIWVTISQDYSMERILVGFLCDEEIDDKKFEESNESLAKLGDQLHKKLYDRRYLVVMDDVWSTETKIKVGICFVRKHLQKMVIATPELKEIGKSIAKGCKGLPFAIVVIGGLLSKSNMTQEYWESVAENVNSFANLADDEHCLKILSLSYNNLPIHLKPCFLYMRVFSDDEEKSISELIRLWVAEGFLKPIKDKTLEEVAQKYLEDLIGRNMILICAWTKRGKMKTCGIHDLLRDLCIRESHKEHFYHVPTLQDIFLLINGSWCFLCRSGKALTRIDLAPLIVVSSQPTSSVSCLVCNNCRNMYPKLNRLRLVEVLEENESFSEEGSDNRWSSEEEDLDDGRSSKEKDPNDEWSSEEEDPNDERSLEEKDPNNVRTSKEKVLDNVRSSEEKDPDDGRSSEDEDPNNGKSSNKEDSDDGRTSEEEDQDDGRSSKEEDPDNVWSSEEKDPDNVMSSEEEDPDNGRSSEEEDPDNGRSSEEEHSDNGRSSENKDILHPTTLRYLFIKGHSIRFVGNLIHLLWNLHTLVISHLKEIVLPSELWEMPQLRHLMLNDAVLPNPPLNTQVDRKKPTIILKNLQTLVSIRNFRWSEDAIERMPNLKELGIYYDNKAQEWSYYSFHNLDRLHKLESLGISCAELPNTLKNIALLHSLKELILWHCGIPWKEMTIIGLLSNLEVLKLYCNAFKGPEWNPVEGEFGRLKKLVIMINDLKLWGAEKFHFPNLECLKLKCMDCLEEIPPGIGEIETLSSIQVYDCKDSVVNSAKNILEEQRNIGNEDLQLYVDDNLVLPKSG